MSRFDAIVNQIYAIIQTSWSQQAHYYAMKNDTIRQEPVQMTVYPHLYVIRINWTPTTYIGLVLAILITLNAYVLAARWARATYRFGFEGDTWDLLRPVDLMAYSLAAYKDLIHDLNTVEHRRMAMQGKTTTVLREYPLWEGIEGLVSSMRFVVGFCRSCARGHRLRFKLTYDIQIGLVSSSNVMQKLDTSTTTSSPISVLGGNINSPSGHANHVITIQEEAHSTKTLERGP